MALTSFDKYFLNLPPLDKKADFDIFWENALQEIKKIPLETVIKKNPKGAYAGFSSYDVSYKGYTRTTITGELLIPIGRPKPKVIIHVHDYNSVYPHPREKLNNSAAHFLVTLRGHHEFISAPETTEEHKSPGYMIENILDRDTYYIKAVFLDVYRCVDMLRLVSDVNCSDIGLIGKGLGAAAAIFTAAHSERVSAMVLDTPSFCYLSLGQNISTSDAANEINEFMTLVKNKKKQIKENLSYFDALNFSDMVHCPVLATVGLKDTISPPECIFGLFNHLLCEKFIEVYPDEGNSAGGVAQLEKSIRWLLEHIQDK
jgi:cephalosporin-C deacetylase